MSNSSEKIAVAIDVGTTTLAASVVAAGGRRLALASAPNPQREFGADVTARLAEGCRSPERRDELTRVLRQGVAALARQACAAAGVSLAAVGRVALAGNPAMEHLLLGLPVERLAYPPYRPLFSDGKLLSTRDLGWQQALPAYLFPLPGGYVGGDLVAFLLAAGEGEEPALFLDVGTNTEVALAAGGKLLATSAPSGPAFEAGNIACGMRAEPGAIASVSMEGERLSLEVVGDGVPAGICGTAVIDAAALLLDAEVVAPSGRLLPPEEVPSTLGLRIAGGEGNRRFILYRDARREIFLSQEDIRQLQLAKGAVRGGIEVLLHHAGITSSDLRRVVLTGAFGARLSPGRLKTIGIFDPAMVHVCGFFPEGAIAGAELAAGSADGVGRVEELARRIRVIPLSGTPLFEKIFLEQLDFPATQQPSPAHRPGPAPMTGQSPR